jgi:hypothetical protein
MECIAWAPASLSLSASLSAPMGISFMFDMSWPDEESGIFMPRRSWDGGLFGAGVCDCPQETLASRSVANKIAMRSCIVTPGFSEY